MGVNDKLGSDIQVLGFAKLTMNTATTTSFDFGTPDDINLAAAASLAKLRHGGRVMVLFSATTAGTTDTVSFVVQDADDSSGSIGTPATALTDGTLTGGTGDQRVLTSVQIQPGRPWLRCRATRTGTTDTHVIHCTVIAVPLDI
jgi:hypothetical protein